MARYTKLQTEDAGLAASIKEAENAADYHTVENRNKRRAMQERRNAIAEQMKMLAENIQAGQQSIAQLHANAETNLTLATYAETWEWKEASPVVS